MIDYATIKPALQVLIVALSEVATLNVTWEDEAKVFGSTQVYLKLAAEIPLALDYETEEIVGEALSTIIQGPRQLPLTIKFEVVGHAATDEANTLLSKVLIRLSRRSTIDTLHDLQLAIVDVNTVPAIAWNDGGNVYSSAILDVMFETVSVDIDTNVPGDEWIETVEVTGTSLDPSATGIPTFIAGPDPN